MTDKPITFVYDTFTADEKRSWAVKGWKRDGVATLPKGVSLVPSGRAATIYLRRGPRFMAFDAELEGVSDVDVCVYTEPGLSSWIDVNTFAATPATPDEQREALRTVTEWLTARGTKFKLHPPTAP